ncbi:MAG: leucyl/phenylalanyl-tRNA--protein transferase [Panacagrimonas sp.]
MNLPWLDPGDSFPDPSQAWDASQPAPGLLAAGGALDIDSLHRAYSSGIFPWFSDGEPILWWSPDPRAVLIPADLYVSTSLRKSVRRGDYAVSLDTAFGNVLTQCSGPRSRSRGTWLGTEMRDAYAQLHIRGYAHSVEVWRAGELIGGLYGVALGRVFFGESMFSRKDDASKLALYWLCQQLIAWDFGLIDCQVGSAHLKSLGATDVSRERFLNLLRVAVSRPPRTGLWRFDIAAPALREHLAP